MGNPTKSNRSIWIGFFLILGVVALASLLSYAGVEHRVKALRGTAALLASTIDNPSTEETSAKYWVEFGLEYSKQLNLALRDAATYEDVNESNVLYYQRNLHGYGIKNKCLRNRE
jgi:hypothetical protein